MDFAAVEEMITSQLSSVIPPGFTMSVDEEGIQIKSREDVVGARAPFLLLATQLPRSDAIETAVLNVLDVVQDYISIAAGRPWPAQGTSHREWLAVSPGVALRGSFLHYWYGEEHAPILSFPPIDVASLLHQ